MSRKPILIPVDQDGFPLPRTPYSSNQTVQTVVPNFVFTETLVFKCVSTGKYSTSIMFETQDKKKPVYIREKDFNEVAPFMINGEIRGKWTMRKCGRLFTAKLVEHLGTPNNARSLADALKTIGYGAVPCPVEHTGEHEHLARSYYPALIKAIENFALKSIGER